MSPTALELNQRERSTLRAVAAGRVEMTSGSEPDLFVDGLCYSDQATAHGLVHKGLLKPGSYRGPRASAVLTDIGRAMLNGGAAR
ncbi:hypothetical protein GCM10025787_38090 [Saccharopolyspora rosea]|uniref:Uncharacterized protein n=1 Tax=Saccharopolyspora rosea TaxID=524884 RepID=A0ABW3FLN1_9PSEU